MITFDSPIALYTTLFGWQFYGIIWEVLKGTGIAYVPFIALVVSTVYEVRQKGDLTQSGATTALKTVETKLLVMLGVAMVAAQPASFTSLSPNRMQAIPYSQGTDAQGLTDSSTVTPGNTTATTYASTFGCPEDASCSGTSVPVPPFWLGIIALTEGVNRAIIEDMPEQTGIRDIRDAVRRMNIADPGIRAEANAFNYQCFQAARSELENTMSTAVSADDIWMGSSVFVNDAKLYPDIRAAQPVAGFPYDSARDIEWEAAPSNGWGKPTCAQWWTGTTGNTDAGLRKKLVSQAELTSTGSMMATLAAHVPGLNSIPASQDFAVRRLLENDPPDMRAAEGMAFGRAAGRTPVRDFARFKNLSLGRQDLQAKVDVLLLAAPFVQSSLRVGLYALLAFFMVADRYSLRSLATGSIVIFTIGSWSVWWHMASWLDENLLLAMFPDTGRIGAIFSDVVGGSKPGHYGSVGTSTKMTLVNLTTAGMYVAFPALFSTVMGMAGIAAAQNINQLATNQSNINSAATGAGSETSKTNKKVASGVKTAATKKLTKA